MRALRNRVHLFRCQLVDDGLERREVFTPEGGRIWGSVEALDGSEMLAAGGVADQGLARVILRASPRARSITARDRLLIDGRPWAITSPPSGALRGWVQFLVRELAT